MHKLDLDLLCLSDKSYIPLADVAHKSRPG